MWGAGLTCGLSAVAAVRGDAARTDELATAAEEVIVPHGVADMHSVLLAARGIAAVAAGRHDDAFAVLRRAFDPADPAYHHRGQFGALGYFAEAAVGCGREAEARAVADSLAALVGRAAAPALLRETVAFARALLGDGAEHARAASPFDRPRLQLACGLRRAGPGRLTDANRLVGLARACLEEAGAPAWGSLTP